MQHRRHESTDLPLSYRSSSAKGALDAYLIPVNMKKGRPGTVLTVIAPAGALEAVRGTIYTETTTLGLRVQTIGREKLERSFVTVV
ncbi:MAG: DUF111 family protein, partial [Spirochaetales bacterium]